MVKLKPLTVGIDLGMTLTGVAYAWNESMAVKMIQSDWPGSVNVIQNKVPTIVVYEPVSSSGRQPTTRRPQPLSSNSGRRLSSWGFLSQAETERDDPAKVSYDFFKLFLDKDVFEDLRSNLRPGLTHNDVVNWYEDFLTQLYKHIRTHFLDTKPGLWAGAVEFVFSVPTTWEPPVVDLFKACFAKAGFGREPGHRAMVTLTEAEAAAVCTAKELEDDFKRGQLLLMCDAGGGTADIALLEVVSSDDRPLRLKQVDSVHGVRAGSTQIDQDFEVYARNKLNKLRQDHPGLIRDVQLVAKNMSGHRNFQVNKHSYGDSIASISFGVPVEGLPYNFAHEGADIENGKLNYYPSKLGGLFDKRLREIYASIDSQIERLGQMDRYQNRKISYLILSGGLGSSRYVKKKLEDRYCRSARFHSTERMTIIKAAEPQLVVAKGLVIDHLREGSTPGPVLQNWIARRSYGVLCVKEWNSYEHLPQDKFRCELTGRALADNQINWVVKKGESLTTGSPKSFEARRPVDPKGNDLFNSWKSYMVVSDLPPDKLPKSTSQGGTRPFCVIRSDMSRFDVDGFRRGTAGWIWGRAHRMASYEIRVLLGNADIKFELWLDDMKCSEEGDIEVHWQRPSAMEEIFETLRL